MGFMSAYYTRKLKFNFELYTKLYDCTLMKHINIGDNMDTITMFIKKIYIL